MKKFLLLHFAFMLCLIGLKAQSYSSATLSSYSSTPITSLSDITEGSRFLVWNNGRNCYIYESSSNQMMQNSTPDISYVLTFDNVTNYGSYVTANIRTASGNYLPDLSKSANVYTSSTQVLYTITMSNNLFQFVSTSGVGLNGNGTSDYGNGSTVVGWTAGNGSNGFFELYSATIDGEEQTIFNENETYRLRCKTYNGAAGLGVYHNASPLIYYVTGEDVQDDDCWWNIIPDGDAGYLIQNALTSDYLKYVDEYSNTVKYLTTTNDPSTTDALWTFTYDESNEAYYITNVAQPNYRFNLRTNGSYLLGCYSHTGTPTSNELFTIYDSNGNIVTGTQSSSSGGSGSSETVDVGNFAIYVDSLQFNDKCLIYDNYGNGRYMFSLPQSARGGGDFTATLKFNNLTNDDISFKIDDQTVSNGGTFTLNNVTCQSAYDLYILVNRTPTRKCSLNFTFMPIVSVNVSSCGTSYYTAGTFHLLDGDAATDDSTYYAKYRHRGATASGKPKKAYAVKMIDENGNSVDRSFLGMRSDNNWILDAAYVDPSRMRNRVSTDLWNDFAHDPYQQAFENKKVSTGTHGQFVEVLLNGTYRGIYCFTEKMDRKQLRLEKTDSVFDIFTDETEVTVRGTLYKTTSWGYEVFMGHNTGSKSYPRTAPSSYRNTSASWCSYEGKYPDVEDGEAFDYKPIWKAVNLVAAGTDQEFTDSFAYYFDKPVIDDYYLFIELLLATDNHGKNMYYYAYDSNPSTKKLNKGFTEKEKIGVAVWDLDGTWGCRWEGSTNVTNTTNYKKYDTYDDFLWAYEHGQLTYFTRLRELSAFDWENTLANRYAELRRTWFQPDSLCKRFTDYYSLFQESGADSRENTLWSTNISNNISYTTQWIQDRIAYLDEQYGYSESTISLTMPAGGFTTYYSSNALKLPSGLTAGIVTAVTSDEVTIDWLYPEGSVVPAGTGIILKGDAGTYTLVTYAAYSGETAPEGNLLHGSDVAATTTGGTYYYRINNRSNAQTVGFYQANSNAGAFTANAHEAYLALDEYIGTSVLLNKTVLFGDVNEDNSVNVSDIVATVNYILGSTSSTFNTTNADINSDNAVNVSDIVGIVNIILGNTTSATSKLESKTEETAIDQLTMQLSSTNKLLMILNNENDFTAFQFDLVLPEGTTLQDASLKRSSGHSVVFAPRGNNRYTILAYSVFNALLPGSMGDLLELTLSNKPLGTITVSNITFCTQSSDSHQFSPLTLIIDSTTSINTAAQSSDSKETLYDLHGRRVRNTNANGIYIENGKKVLK